MHTHMHAAWLQTWLHPYCPQSNFTMLICSVHIYFLSVVLGVLLFISSIFFLLKGFFGGSFSYLSEGQRVSYDVQIIKSLEANL